MKRNFSFVIRWRLLVFNRQSGQSLIEVLVSVGIAVILAVSLITTSLYTQKSARSARNNAQATKLVQQYLEQVRIFRDRKGFDALPTSSNCYFLDTADSDPRNWFFGSSPCPETETVDVTSFDRKIEVADDGADKKLFTVTVSWQEAGTTYEVKSQTYLSRWDEFP